MDISFSDRSTMLIFGGLTFIFISFVKVNGYQNGKISLKVPEGNKKYLIFFGILIIIVGIFLPMNDSEQQHNDVPLIINNNNNLTQTITSEQRQGISTILENSKNSDRNVNENINTNANPKYKNQMW